MSAAPTNATPLEQTANRQERMHLVMAGLIAAMAVAARIWMARTTHATGEDFLIILRYAENIAAGRGFVYNPGERVLGSTTPLYTLLLALAADLHLNATLVGKGCNILADGVTCLLLYRLLAHRKIGSPMAGVFAACLYAFGSTPISIAISGMETALVTCAGLAAILAYLDDRWRDLLLLSALLFLLRIDTLALSGILIVALALRTRTLAWRDAGLALLLVLPWVVFACWYFGSPVPTSLVAKLTVYRGSMGASRASIFEAFSTQFIAGWPQRILTLLFAVGAARIVQSRSPLAAPLVWLLVYYGAMLFSHVPAFGWYFLPPWPLYLALAVLGGQAVIEQAGHYGVPQSGAPSTAIPLVALAVIALMGAAHLPSIRGDIARAQLLEDRVRMPLGLWLRAHTAPQERILLEPIGTIGYYSQRPILDLIGLVSPEVFPSYRTPTPLADMVRRLHPEWLCLRPHEVERLRREAPGLLESGYRLQHSAYGGNGATVFLLFHRGAI